MIERYPVLQADDSNKLPENLSVIYKIGQEIISRNREENSELFGGKFISHMRVSFDENGEIEGLFLCGNNFAEGQLTDYYGDRIAVSNVGEDIFLVGRNDEKAQEMKEEETKEYLKNLVL